jgi:hypothetical protein
MRIVEWTYVNPKEAINAACQRSIGWMLPCGDVDLVGPGPAYERWKKTPEYQRWLSP